ncbi:MAG TPA: EamA family transporter [Candidatus Synoicihabitans sp.]|nr:EamA family transporter [Candidatus Synoicihabitans sp.]
MLLLLIVSVVWAFSFGLLKSLVGLDPVAIAVARLGFAALVFVPLLRPRRVPTRVALQLAGIGAVQFGVMYVCYIWAFRFVAAYEVALFTIFTPLYVALVEAALARRVVPQHLVAALLAIAGAGVMLWQRGIGSNVSTGFLLMQASNLCFAAGQIWYRRTRSASPSTSDAALFGWLYLGALATVGVISVGTTDWSTFRPTSNQTLVLVYLGLVASGLGFFGWNLGALRVNAGTLAVFNNLKIPLAVAVSLLVFGEQANLTRLLVSFALIAAGVAVAERRSRGP